MRFGIGIGLVNRRRLGGALSWSPADLFANGEQGSFWGPLPYYSDAAGTVEAGWGDPVGNIPDASGNGQDWAQVTSTARPILGRVPVGGRRNLLSRTEEFDNPYWTNQFSYPVDQNSRIAPDGSMTMDGITSSSTSLAFTRSPLETGSAIAGKSFTVSIWYFAEEDLRFDLRVRGTGSTREEQDFPVSLTANTLTRKSFTYTPVAADGTALLIAPIFRLGIGKKVWIWGAQLETGSVATPYQRVGNEYDITEAGVKGIHYLRFDGTDDAVTTTLPAISGGTIVLAGTNGIWIDELNFAGGAFSVGPDTYTGGPAGLLPILGDILVEGGFVIDRALTPKEIAQVKRYYVARGSAGLFTLVDERIPQPLDFTAPVWTQTPAVTGRTEKTFTTSGPGGMSIDGAVTGGDTYIAQAYFTQQGPGALGLYNAVSTSARQITAGGDPLLLEGYSHRRARRVFMSAALLRARLLLTLCLSASWS